MNQQERTSTFSVAANYEPSIVPQLSRHPVSEVYGKLPRDLVGGGRPSYLGTDQSFRQLEDYVGALRDAGIRFNYLFNSACLGNREWSRGWQRKFDRLSDKLLKMGTDTFTVSTPYLLEVMRTRHPELRLKVGIFAQVDTPRRARFWEELGADAITLESFSINRNFARLKEIRDAVNCDLQLIVNHCCLPNCPMQVYHQNGFAHSSDRTGRLFIDYCFFKCSRLRCLDPSLYIKSAWIRPEDLGAYEDLGYHSFKLTERGLPSNEVLKRVQAYSARKFEGNLAELLLFCGSGQVQQRGIKWLLRHFFKPSQVLPWKLKSLYRLADEQGMFSALDELPVRIDGNRLPVDFLEKFRTLDCSNTDCRQCGYCATVAESTVRIDEEYRQRVLQHGAAAEQSLLDGSFW